VGVIEEQVGYSYTVNESGGGKYGPLDKGYALRKLTVQTYESQELLDMLTADMAVNDRVRKEMVSFLSKIFGHVSWERMVQMRWLR